MTVSIDVNLITVLIGAIPATLAAIVSFIQTLRNGAKLDDHTKQMEAINDNVNGKMNNLIITMNAATTAAANLQGRQDERDMQLKGIKP
jgi:hypothetical protein